MKKQSTFFKTLIVLKFLSTINLILYPINLNNLHSSKRIIGKQRYKRSVKIESYYQADFDGEEFERIKTEKLNQNIYKQSFQNCLTEDKEVEDGSQQSDIDCQTDINLFENIQNYFVYKKDLDVQQNSNIYPFPIKGQLQNSQVKNESNLSSLYSQSFEEESLTESKEVVQEPKQTLPLAVKPILNKEKVMILVWVNLPSIYMNNLRNFGLSENSEYPQQSENKEEGKEAMLIKKIEIKRCVKILDKWQSIRTKKKVNYYEVPINYQKKLIKTLGYSFSTKFKLIDQKQMYDQNIFQIVQSLEEQLFDQLQKKQNEIYFWFLIRVLNQISQMQQIMLRLLSVRQTKIENQQMLLVLPIVKEEDLQKSVQQIKNRLMFISMRKWIK
ncbi:unnamed protein product [Paramecium primaurelia]|uniref:Uncharacterized protein n=1 Tax=Paramecium primaurelia TaxID=5886 RepID=A0A8S1NTP9_PARPR|nr:unnamed protein product [Paramecium primaurelia]